MKKGIEVKVTHEKDIDVTRIESFVDGYSVIKFSNGLYNTDGSKRWITSSSSTLPADTDEAKRYIVAFNMAVQKLEEIKKQQKNG